MRGIKRQITDAQRRWLTQHFACTANAECLAALGWPANAWRTLRRIAADMGLEKSREFMAGAQANAARQAAIANRGEGNEGKRNLLVYGAAHRFQKGVTSAERLGEERNRERLRKAHATRNATIRSERMRIKWGLPQRTNLKLTGSAKHRNLRHSLKKRGYIVARGAHDIYYNGDTRRSTLVESHAAANGFTFYKL